MLAKRELPAEFERWNRKWGAPAGRRGATRLVDRVVDPLSPVMRAAVFRSPVVKRARGPFSLQHNSSTRAYEFPWAYHQLAGLGHGRLLEIGGALSGLQFVLSKEGYQVHNVDPFFDYGDGEYGVDPVAEHAELNRLFATNVSLRRATLPQAGLSGPFAAAYSVSTIEHLSPEDIEATLKAADALLVPGGLLVLTVDLFVNLAPFTKRETNRWGRNISVAWLQDVLGYDLVAGDKNELNGYDEFSAERVLSSLEDYALHRDYPQLAQLFTLKKPGGTA